MKQTLPLIAIMGATTSGKTALSLRLAEIFEAEVVSADARQIYFGMDIGTDKIVHRSQCEPRVEKAVSYRGIPHYLIDILNPDSPYSAAQFRDDADTVINNIHNNNKLPIMVGGTGFYIRVATSNMELPQVPPDFDLRNRLRDVPLQNLVDDLKNKDPEKAKRIDLKNPRRIIRALEIASHPKQPPTNNRQKRWSILKIALRIDKDTLKQNVQTRVRHQINAGLVEEVRTLVQKYGEKAPGLQTICYREFLPFLRGEARLEETTEEIVRSNLHYAKRQATWLKKEPDLTWANSPDDAVEIVKNWYQP